MVKKKPKNIWTNQVSNFIYIFWRFDFLLARKDQPLKKQSTANRGRHDIKGTTHIGKLEQRPAHGVLRPSVDEGTTLEHRRCRIEHGGRHLSIVVGYGCEKLDQPVTEGQGISKQQPYVTFLSTEIERQ